MSNIYILHPKNMQWQRNMGGIYKITFGNKYYIGKTQLLNKRLFEHELSINKSFEYYKHGLKYSAYGMYINLIKYLIDNPKIKIGYIELIQPCLNTKQMDYYESEILFNLRYNDDCLNIGKHNACINRKIGTELPSCKIYEQYRWFYNPKLNVEIFELDDITLSGTPKKINSKVSMLNEKRGILQQFIDKYDKLY